MKIVIVIADISKTGGTERATINLANMLCQNHEVKILTISDKKIPFFELNKNVKIDALGLQEIPKAIYKKVSWFLSLYRSLKKKLEIYSPDIIVGEGHNISTILPFSKNIGARTIASEHIDYDSIPSWSRALMKYVYPKHYCVVVLSHIARNKILPINKKVEVIPNTLPFESNSNADLVNQRIIMVGRISKEKGYDRLVPIAEKLQQEFPTWKIEIFGNGDLKSQIIELFREKQLHNVQINEPVKDIQNEYLKSSILFITSYSEAMPMVILEAQSCGLPVIGFRCEGTETLIKNDETGFVVESADEFYSKTKLLISDLVRRQNMGISAKKEASYYNSENIKKLWEKILNNY